MGVCVTQAVSQCGHVAENMETSVVSREEDGVTVELVWRGPMWLGEGPLWHPTEGALYYVRHPPHIALTRFAVRHNTEIISVALLASRRPQGLCTVGAACVSGLACTLAVQRCHEIGVRVANCSP
jgi:hypothetical protein